MKIGLALGSGGARGLAHIGVIQALKDSGISIDYIAGSSMGALIGAVFAANQSVDELESMVENFSWKSLLKLFIPTLSRSGIVDGDNIVKFLEEHIAVSTFDQLQIPLSIETTNLKTGELVTINSGEVIPAVRASISIPMIFTPVTLGYRTLVDGGLISPVPVQTVRDMGAEFIIAVNVLAKNKSWDPHEKKRQKPTKSSASDRIPAAESLLDSRKDKPRDQKGFLVILTQTIGITMSKLAQLQLELESPDLLIEPDTSSINVYDFHRGNELLGDAYTTTMQSLDSVHGI